MPTLARSVPKPLKVSSLARSVHKLLKVPSLARSMRKPLKVASLARSVPKPLKVPSLARYAKVPSLARYVPKLCVGEAREFQTCHYHRCRPPTSWLWMKWMMSKFWVFDFYETFICYRGYFKLNCYIGKKVQKNFLMGLKIWWSWGSGIFFSKSQQVGRFLDFRPKL